jgi:signal peptidase I
MEPAIPEKTHMIGNGLVKEFKRGDVVIMDTPSGGLLLVKRVVGLPRETVEIDGGMVFIDGNVLDESDYLPAETFTSGALDTPQYNLGDNEYFLLGDHRDESFDSRSFGPVNGDDILWKIIVIL